MDLIDVGFSAERYYRAFNNVYFKNFGKYFMLHYPLYRSDSDNLFRCQENLTDYCIEKLGSIKGKRVLEVGCGNGVQSIFILNRYHPAEITGVDIDESNIKIANDQKKVAGVENVRFLVSDAQNLIEIADNSVDIVLNIESAFHYPDKTRFLKEVRRVLKPGGKFLIADILMKKDRVKRTNFYKRRMSFYHWPISKYREAFTEAGLMVSEEDDVTDRIYKGFSISIEWFKTHPEVFKNKVIELWAYIMLVLNRWLLKKMRRYLIFTGIKPD